MERASGAPSGLLEGPPRGERGGARPALHEGLAADDKCEVGGGFAGDWGFVPDIDRFANDWRLAPETGIRKIKGSPPTSGIRKRRRRN